jgi:hypothetical protein
MPKPEPKTEPPPEQQQQPQPLTDLDKVEQELFIFISDKLAPDAAARRVIQQLLNINLQLRVLVVLLVSTLPYVVKVKNYS